MLQYLIRKIDLLRMNRIWGVGKSLFEPRIADVIQVLAHEPYYI